MVIVVNTKTCGDCDLEAHAIAQSIEEAVDGVIALGFGLG
jgi:hypothetical protein